MEIICPSCQAHNDLQNKNCSTCRTPLLIGMSTQFWVEDQPMTLASIFHEIRHLKEDKDKLSKEFQSLQSRFEVLSMQISRQFRELKEQLGSRNIENIPIVETEKVSEIPIYTPEEKINPYEKPAYLQNIEQEHEKRLREEANKQLAEAEAQKRLREEELTRKTAIAKAELERVEKERQRTYIPPIQQETTTPPPPPIHTTPPPKPFEMPAFVVEFFAPLVSVYQFVATKYEEFKAQNKLPLFFLTLAGISALLFGVGFLVRYSATTWFGDLSVPVKSAVGFSLTAAIIGLGLYLIHKDKIYNGFGSALTGLGIALNYLFIYFLEGSIAPQWNFMLILINSAIAIGLALRYETKVIALLSLVAGGLSPLYLESTGNGSAAYFVYLWVLCAASVFIAKRIRWELLILVALGLSATIAGLAVYIDTSKLSDAMHLGLHHAFAYLFTYAALFDGKRLKAVMNTLHVVVLLGAQIAILSSLSYILGYYHPHYTWLAIAYFINSLPFIALLAWAMKRMDNQTVSLMFSLVAAFWAFGVAAIAHIDYYGVFWGMEGILFLSCGFVLQLPFARRLGYLILVGSFASMGFAIRHIPAEWMFHLSPNGIVNLVAIGVFLSLLYAVLKRFEVANEQFEQRLRLLVSEAISIWLIISTETIIFYYTPKWIGQTAALVSFAILARAYRFQLPFSKQFGYFTFSIGIALIALIAAEQLSNQWGVQLFHEGYFNLISIGLWLSALMLGLYKLNAPAKAINFIEHSLAVWAMSFFWVSLGFYCNEYTLNLAILPLFGFLYWGGRREKQYIELLGAAHFAALVLAIFLSVEIVHTFRFSMQLVYGKIAMIEAVAVLWLTKSFYQYVLPESKQISKADLARELSYLIIASIPFNFAFSEAYEYVAFGAWASVALGFLLSDFTQKRSLAIEFYGLLVLASLFTFTELEYFAMPLGAALLLGIYVYKKGYKPDEYNASIYKYAFTYTFYYIGLCAIATYWGLLSQHFVGVAALGGAYLLMVSQFKDKIFALSSTAAIAYRAGWASIILGLLNFASLMEMSYLPLEIGLFVAFFALGIGAIFAQVYWIRSLYIGEKNELVWKVDVAVAHAILAFFYFDLFYYATGEPANLLLTVAMVLHGVSLVLQASRPMYKTLIWFYAPLLVSAVVKLFLWDMRNAPTIHRILAFIGVGVIFLIAAFLFVRYAKKEEEDKNNLIP